MFPSVCCRVRRDDKIERTRARRWLPFTIFPGVILNSLPSASHVLFLTEEGTLMELASEGKMENEWIGGLEEFARLVTMTLRDSARRISETNQTSYQPISGWFLHGRRLGCVRDIGGSFSGS